MKCYISLICICMWQCLSAQNINKAEYFIDMDPGVGLATAISISQGSTLDINLTLPVGILTEGLHTIGIRVGDEDGLWSLYERKNFIVQNLAYEDIIVAEYFIDVDPGIGNATSIAIASSGTVQQNLTLAIPNLSEGLHLWAIRVKDAKGHWSLYERKNLIVQHLDYEDIVAAEYFIDADPGVGNATNIAISGGGTVQQNLTLAIPNLLEGLHLLAVRVKDANGHWSLFERKNFIVQPLVYDDIVAAEYFIDADPGVGNAIPVPVTTGASIDEDLLLMIPNTTTTGDHKLALRVLDSKGTWSLYGNHLFKVCPLMTTDPTFVNASCAESTDGSAAVNPSGGMSPYTFNWSNGQTTSGISGLSPGVYHVTITGADDCETIEHITIGVVADLEYPVITCPSNISISTEVGECGKLVNFSANASDNCDGTTISYVPASGYIFNVGNTTVTATATDAAGNESECTFTVSVSDDENPVINCPANISVSGDVGECSKAISYSATATDNCEGLSISYSHASGSNFIVGTTTVTATATDVSNNASECTFMVTVSDDENPVINCPANISVSADVGECSKAISYSATATDNCEGVVLSYSHESGSIFNVGSTTITATAIDASGNASECTFTITVSDDENPVITCPPNISVSAEPGECNNTVSYSATASDNCSESGINYILIENSDFESGNTGFSTEYTFAPTNTTEGEYNVLTNPQSWNGGFSACTDHTVGTGKMLILNGHPVAGKKVWCQQVPTIVGNTYYFEFWSTSVYPGNASHIEVMVDGTPIGNFIEDDLCSWEKSSYSFVASNSISEICIRELTGTVFPNDFAIDDISLYEIITSTVQITLSHESGSDFMVGTTTVTAIATDESGNESECTFTVTITDEEFPIVNCPSNISVSADAGECSKSVSYSASVTDNCGGTSISYSPASSSIFNIGTTEVVATATDASGNASQCIFSVTVSDDESPEISCPSNISVSADGGECGKSVSYSADASDNCEGLTISYTPESGSAFNVGNTTVIATATDASGNVSECTFTVTVSDEENPQITCPDPITETLEEGICTKNVSYTATGTDNCEVSGISFSPASGSSFNIGLSTVTATVTDIYGNVNSCTFTVTINPNAEICDNDIDDDCDGAVDEGCGGTDTDGDGIEDEEDNCPTNANPDQEDSDCDGVGNVCDVCPGGDDTIDNNNDGQPDCHVYPGFSNLPASWKCGNNNNKVYVCHNGNNPQTVCVSPSAVQAHLDHGDYLGPCDESQCNGNLKILPKNLDQTQDHFEQFMNATKLTKVNISIRPNPVMDYMEVYFEGTWHMAHLSIWDVYGKRVWDGELDEITRVKRFDKNEITSWNSSGLYILRFECDGVIQFLNFMRTNKY